MTIENENKTESELEDLEPISVIIPESPFDKGVKRYVCALNVEKLMDWWPGKVHQPERDPKKVKYIQRSLDWKRVAHIAAYLLQEDIIEATDKLKKCFTDIYGSEDIEPGREWPPKVGNVISYQPSVCPDFSNILIHVNGAVVKKIKGTEKTAHLVLNNKNNPDFELTVIDGQHRVNGAYFALFIKKVKNPEAVMDLPATVYLNLDPKGSPPQKQAQIFVDVNFYQKKVDKSLAVDLFPTARAGQKGKNSIDRAQDISRKLMLESGPLVGMVQIPGIKYGVKGVITLATLASAIENILDDVESLNYITISEQTWAITLILEAWFRSTGRKEEFNSNQNFEIGDDNAVYQGRLIVSIIYLIPGILVKHEEVFKKANDEIIISEVRNIFKKLLKRARLLKNNKFISKYEFKKHGFLGSGGIGRLRNLLWASMDDRLKKGRLKDESIKDAADKIKEILFKKYS